MGSFGGNPGDDGYGCGKCSECCSGRMCPSDGRYEAEQRTESIEDRVAALEDRVDELVAKLAQCSCGKEAT